MQAEKEKLRRQLNTISSDLERLEQRAKASAPAEVAAFQDAIEVCAFLGRLHDDC